MMSLILNRQLGKFMMFYLNKLVIPQVKSKKYVCDLKRLFNLSIFINYTSIIFYIILNLVIDVSFVSL